MIDLPAMVATVEMATSHISHVESDDGFMTYDEYRVYSHKFRRWFRHHHITQWVQISSTDLRMERTVFYFEIPE